MESESSSQQFETLLSEFKILYNEGELSAEQQSAWANRFLELALAHRSEQAGIDAFLFITRQDRRCMTFKKVTDTAAEHLIRLHSDRRESEVLIYELRNSRTPRTNDILDSLIRSSNQRHKGLARFSRAHKLARGKETKSDAVALFESVIQEHSDLAIERFGETICIRTLAEQGLVEIREHQVGMLAPDIVGTDLNGDSLKLSDFRDKTVMLSFWGDW